MNIALSGKRDLLILVRRIIAEDIQHRAFCRLRRRQKANRQCAILSWFDGKTAIANHCKLIGIFSGYTAGRYHQIGGRVHRIAHREIAGC